MSFLIFRTRFAWRLLQRFLQIRQTWDRFKLLLGQESRSVSGKPRSAATREESISIEVRGNRKTPGRKHGVFAPTFDFLREDQKKKTRRRGQGIQLGGMIAIAAGVGTMILLRGIVTDQPVYLAGLIPTFVGIVLLAYSFTVTSKD